jgi:O-antigen/teichoic acid export membrane protein
MILPRAAETIGDAETTMRREVRDSVILAAGTGVSAVLSLAYAVYVGRVAGTAGYGDFTAALSIAAFGYIALGPINGTVAMFAARYAARGALGKVRTLWRETGRRVALYGLIPLVSMALVLQPLTSLLQLRSPVVLALAGLVVYLSLLLSPYRGVLRGLQLYGKLNVNVVGEALLRLACGAVTLSLFANASGGLLGYVGASLLIVIVAHIQVRWLVRAHPPESVDGAPLRRMVGPMLVLALCTAGFQHVDMLMVKCYFPREPAGVYGAAATLARSMSVLVTPFSTLLLPMLAVLREQGRPLGGTIVRIGGYYAIAASLTLVAFALFARPLVGELYGPDYLDAASVLPVLAAALSLAALTSLLGLAFAALQRFGFLAAYAAGLVVEVIALILWHDSLRQVVTVLLIVQAATFVVLTVLLAQCVRRSAAAGK